MAIMAVHSQKDDGVVAVEGTNGSNSCGEYPPSYHETATEDTPLLLSEASSPTLRNASPALLERREVNEDDPVHSVTPLRAAFIVASMWILIFLQACNMSGMTMVQGDIAADLNSYENAMWFTSSYMITIATMAPLVGRLSTIFTPGTMILVSAFFFAIGAVVTSQAHSFAIFILGRVLVGVGGGGIMTLSLILVLQLTSKRRRGLFIGIVNTGFTIGVSAGAVVFGALLPVMGWRALFWIQAPVGALAGLGVYLSMPDFAAAGKLEDKRTTLQKLAKIDYAGALSLITTIVLFLYGLSGTIQICPMLLSIFPFILFLMIEYRIASDPLIPLNILQSRGVLLSCFAQLFLMSARWTVLYYAPIFVLAVRGLPATVAGSVLIPTNFGFGFGGILIGWLHVRRAGSFWLPAVLSVFLFGVSMLGLSFTSSLATPTWLYVLVVFVIGFCTGATLNYTLAHLLHLTEPETHYIATGLLATFRGFAGSFGTSIGGGVFTRKLKEQLALGFERLDGSGSNLVPGRTRLITRLVASPAMVWSGGLSDAEREVAIRGYENALRVLYQSAALLTVFVLVLQAGTGSTGPAVQETEEEIREEIEEHDSRMEA